MSKANKISILVVMAALAGCASQRENYSDTSVEDIVNKNIQKSVQDIKLSQAELYQAGMLSHRGLTRPVQVKEDLQLVTIHWAGDAKELLTKMSHDRGWEFYLTGNKMPLPVSIKVDQVPFDQVMQMIQSQIGYRAQLIKKDNSLSLQYQRPRTITANKKGAI